MNRALFALSFVLFPVMAMGAQAAPPATEPAPAQPIANASILILPIESPGGNYAWVGRAIQQDMLVDLTQMTKAHVIAPSGTSAADTEGALRAAHEAGANYVVFGVAQSSGSQLRVTGQVLDVATGKSLVNLKATAPADDLFPLEDALSIQVVRALPGATLSATAPQGGESQRLPTVVNEPPYVSEATPAPQYDSVSASNNGPYVYQPYAYPNYYYPYYPGYYYPGYLGFGFGFGSTVVITGHHFHDHDHDHFDHGFDHRNFVSPHVNPGMMNHGAFRGSPSFGGARSFGGMRGGFGGAPGGGGFSGGAHVGGGMGGGGAHGR